MDLCSSEINIVDLLIVGAGPIGLITAIWFAKKNYNIVLIEQYGEQKNGKKGFNERHQQIALNPNSLKFIKNLDIVVWGEINRKGCMSIERSAFGSEDWINIPIYILQNIFMKEIRKYKIKILFNTKIESVKSFDPNANCRVLMITDKTICGVLPKLIVIADGRHDDKGTAKIFFDFPSASKVHLCTCGIIGMIIRDINEEKASVCLRNYSSGEYTSDLYKDVGLMHVRLLGNMSERYIALGIADDHHLDYFRKLDKNKIRQLLVEAYNKLRDQNMGEPEITEKDFSDYSKEAVHIVLDYRKETIKLFEGSTTIVSVEGDAARKTTFFSGSGLNTGYEALEKLFNFCEENEFILNNTNDPNFYLKIDQKLLEKDQECMNISLKLLQKGLQHISGANLMISHNINEDPIIYSIYPEEAEVPWFIRINGKNLIGEGGKVPSITFKWDNDFMITNKVIVYDNNTVGVKVPQNATNKVFISLQRFDEKITDCPVAFTVIKLSQIPIITDVYREDDWLSINGQHFKIKSYVIVKHYSHIVRAASGMIRDFSGNIKQVNDQYKIKSYCNSVSSLIFMPLNKLSGKIGFIVETENGVSKEFIKDFDI